MAIAMKDTFELVLQIIARISMYPEWLATIVGTYFGGVYWSL